ncbi:MAG: hypothetical protein WDM90_11080 [Ferruginibacter sp.]
MNRKRAYKNENDEESKDADEIRSFPLYGMLACGIIIFIIGLYMFFSNFSTYGLAAPRYGGLRNVTITGKGAIMLGFAICVFPIYQLIKQRKK